MTTSRTTARPRPATAGLDIARDRTLAALGVVLILLGLVAAVLPPAPSTVLVAAGAALAAAVLVRRVARTRGRHR